MPLPVNWRPPPPRQQSFLRPSTLGMVECVSFSGEHHRLGTPPAFRLVVILRAFWALGSGRARRAVWVRTQPTHFQSYIFPPQSHISLDPIFQGGVLGQALVGRGGELSSGAPRFQTSALRLSRLPASRYSNAAKTKPIPSSDIFLVTHPDKRNTLKPSRAGASFPNLGPSSLTSAGHFNKCIQLCHIY